MRVLCGTQVEFAPENYTKLLSYRYQVFVERLKWELNTIDGLEKDQFDRPDTVYVISRDDVGNITGCGRLLPTTQPYLLGEVFPQLLNGQTPPADPEVWELSRFASVDFNAQTTSALGQFSSQLTAELLNSSIRCAAELGAKRLITVSPIGIERLLKRMGIHAHRAGPPMVVNGHPIFACWIECE
jgi:N-acyl-L-homoserine lactone synthetase